MPHRIYIFEDNPSNLSALQSPLEEQLDDTRYEVDSFLGQEPDPDDLDDTEYVKQLLTGGDGDYPLLVVLDAELNEYNASTVRRADVREVCSELGIPICVYHRDSGEYADPQSVKESDDQIIRLVPRNGGHSRMAAKCAAIVEGFEEIRSYLNDRMADATAEELLEPPSEIIKELEDVPISARPDIDKYSWGQSESLAVLNENEGKEDAIRRKATILGYWMVNQLLEYPGVLVNRIAAASYLGIEVEAFQEDEEVQAVFEDAEYNGPFSGLEEYWWTAELDSILERNSTVDDDGTVSAIEYLSRSGIDVSPVKCVEEHEGAGYYCILEDVPVCEEHSVSPEAWIPAGASLSRLWEEAWMKLKGW
jgi:hypothetical protein